MLFLGIDQYAHQLTVSLRKEAGDGILARRVSTHPDKVNEFFQRLTRDRLRSDEPFKISLDGVPCLTVGGCDGTKLAEAGVSGFSTGVSPALPP